MGKKKLKLEQLSVDSFVTSIDEQQKETVQGGTDSVIVCSLLSLSAGTTGITALSIFLVPEILPDLPRDPVRPSIGGDLGDCPVTFRINCPSIMNKNCDLPWW